MRQINYERVALTVARYFVQNKRVCISSFVSALKGLLNGAEATRLFEYFCDTEKILVPINKIYFRWSPSINESHFRDDSGVKIDYIRDIFLNNSIQSNFGPSKPSLAYNEATGEFEPQNMLDMTSFDDESLECMRQCIVSEQQKRKAAAEKKQKLEEILSVIEMSREELLDLLK